MLEDVTMGRHLESRAHERGSSSVHGASSSSFQPPADLMISEAMMLKQHGRTRGKANADLVDELNIGSTTIEGFKDRAQRE